MYDYSLDLVASRPAKVGDHFFGNSAVARRDQPLAITAASAGFRTNLAAAGDHRERESRYRDRHADTDEGRVVRFAPGTYPFNLR